MSRQAARGFDGISLVVFDEAQELTDDQIEAIMATLSASSTGTRQIIYTGTPPYPVCPGEVFRKRRNECLTDPSKRDCWHEWSVSADNITQINVTDTSLWYMCNPALGIRLSEEFTSDEQRTLSPDGFARERLGWWMPQVEIQDEYAIAVKLWDGVKFTPDGSEICLAGAVIGPDNKARIELIDRRPTGLGTQWLADWLNTRQERACCVVIDGRNGVDILIDKIADRWRIKGSIIKPGAKDYIAAVSTVIDGLTEKSLSWYAEQEELRESAITCTKRPIGKAGAWGFGGENCAPLEACALALWGVKNCKRDPSKKMKIG